MPVCGGIDGVATIWACFKGLGYGSVADLKRVGADGNCSRDSD